MAINMNMKNTQSNVLRKVTPIKNIIVDIIDNNQNIKRACRYITSKTPFFTKGITYDDKKVNQPDIEGSLKEDLADSKDVYATCREKILIPYAFDKELLKEDKMLIFVESPRSRIKSGNNMVEHEFWVTVAVDTKYNKLEPYGSERAMEVLCYLLDDIENKYLEDEYREDLGVLKFEVDGDRLTQKISDKGFIATSIPIVVKTSGMRF